MKIMRLIEGITRALWDYDVDHLDDEDRCFLNTKFARPQW